MSDDSLLERTVDIVASYLANNRVGASDLPDLIKNVHQALKGLGQTPPEPQEALKPAVSIRSSVKPDFLISLESGKKMKMLKRYLMTNYGMTPDDYRQKWGLPADYPMVAATYAEARSNLAKTIGLGRTRPLAAAAKPSRTMKR